MTIAFLFIILFVFMAIGMPIAVSLGLSSLLTILFFGHESMASQALKLYETASQFTLLAIPFFILSGAFMTTGGVARRMIRFANACIGHLRAGLGLASVLACMLFAAVSGSSPATVVAVGSIVIGGMVRAGYSKEFAAGVICNAGTLGILIPPSVMAIVYAVVAQQSLGELLIGSVFPGLLLSGMYIAYVTIRCYINPALGPALPIEERVGIREKVRLLRNTITPVLLIILVLGIIFVGIATPVEAAGIGTFGALAVCALHRRLTWVALYEAAMSTLKATAMVMWIFFGATMFVGFFIIKGGQTFVAQSILATGLPPYGILLLMMVILFVLGMFLDWVGIMLLTVPIFLPILTALPWGGLAGIAGVKPDDVSLWYGVIFMVNMQMAFLSPPFGYSLFYLKSVAPKEITMAMIFRSAMPFIGLQAIGNALCIIFPQIILWLPGVLYQGTK